MKPGLSHPPGVFLPGGSGFILPNFCFFALPVQELFNVRIVGIVVVAVADLVQGNADKAEQ